ncbi:uncharacterized protein [Trachinotus anak]|uniref:uncharacterized protein n=1 Tax=Trachinotus anak TaxID=443729 RepID=UPI0039F1C923
MATEDGEDVQRAGLKRKLTGPPRLLLGKTRTRSVGDDRLETQTEKDGDKTSLKNCEGAKLTVSPDMEDKVLSEVNVESCSWRCEVTGEVDDIKNRKVNRRRWWRRFSPVVVCIRRQKENEEDAAGGNCISEDRRRSHLRFRTSSDPEPSVTVHRKLRRLFTRGRRSRSSGLENKEDMMRLEEVLCSPDEPQSDGTNQSPEALTVTAETDVQLTEDRAPAESPESATEVTEEDLTADGSGTIQTDGEAVEGTADTDEVVSPERDEVFSTEVVLDLDDHPPAWTVSSEEKPDQTQSLQPSTNGPSIRIELVPPDDVILDEEEEEEEECSENQKHLLLLLGFAHSERQLLQTARSLVRAAMNAAVDQLTREQLSGSDCVHREPQGCRDHA